jgi:hypothetical protein
MDPIHRQHAKCAEKRPTRAWRLCDATLGEPGVLSVLAVNGSDLGSRI